MKNTGFCPRQTAPKRHSTLFLRTFLCRITHVPHPRPTRPSPHPRLALPASSDPARSGTCYRIFLSKSVTATKLNYQEEQMIILPSCLYNLKTVGAHRGPAPSPFLFASVKDWVQPSTPLKHAFSLNATAPRHYSELLDCNPTKKMHCSSWPGSRTHP